MKWMSMISLTVAMAAMVSGKANLPRITVTIPETTTSGPVVKTSDEVDLTTSPPALDSSKCPPCLDERYLEHYRRKKCIAVYDADNCGSLCPVRYDCSEYEAKSSSKLSVQYNGSEQLNSTQKEGQTESAKCEHLGIEYAIGEDVKTPSSCERCVCHPNMAELGGEEWSANYTFKTAAISCASVECPQMFGVPPYPLDAVDKDPEQFKNCYYSHDNLDTCCASGTKCPTDKEVLELPTCDYNNRTYRTGEKIYPKENDCLVCMCDEKWNISSLDTSTCKRFECSSSPRDFKNLERGCVPIYHEKTCCAIDYHCPPLKKDATDKVNICSQPPMPKDSAMFCKGYLERYFYNGETGKCEQFIYGGCGGSENIFEDQEDCEAFCQFGEPQVNSSTSGQGDICTFGGRPFELGQVSKTNSICVECKCILPPDLSCIQRSCPQPAHESCRAHFKFGDCCPTFDCSEKNDDCIVFVDQQTCPSANCTKYLDDKGCARCQCQDAEAEFDPDSCPTPLCAANCQMVYPETQCPTCECDEQVSTEATNSEPMDSNSTEASLIESTTASKIETTMKSNDDEPASG
ncbi:PI-actitoxin-Aeq3a [Halotydeus destructor]|nr:PI-actitoxin-Aeq3a [Halotydeus destructor]